MKRYGTVSVKDMMDILNTVQEPRTQMFGFSVKLESQRLQLFKRDGVKCVKCGLEGNIFVVEGPKDVNPHINLYYQDTNGKRTLFTKDHIHPKHLGGKDYMDNYQVMCMPCNSRKGHSYIG